MKRVVYGVPLWLLAAWGAYEEWWFVCGISVGLWLGFVIAVQMTYKAVTGEKLDDDTLTEVVEKILP
ncbi:MAG: hypothetical protein ACRBCS_03205 [Cellvibrionaceae bacterium]